MKRVQQQPGYKRIKRGYRSGDDLQRQFPGYKSPGDPYFAHQWYLKNTGQADGKPRLDLNVEEAWAMGFTGKNVTTAIMDDGVDYTHPDLMNNFVSSLLLFWRVGIFSSWSMVTIKCQSEVSVCFFSRFIISS